METTGRTVDEAKDAALDQLGVDETDAEFVVLSEPRPGLFGRMRGEARVRARVAPTSPRPKRGRSRRSAPEPRRGGRQARGGRTATAVVEEEDGPAAGGTDASANGSAAAGPPGGVAGQGGARRRSRGSRGRGSRGSGQGNEQTARRPAGAGRKADVAESDTTAETTAGRRRGRAEQAAADEEGTPVTEMSLEEQGQAAQTFVEGLLREMGLAGAVSLRMVDDTTAEVAVEGDGLGILVGPRGATLGALQELTRTVVQKHTGGHSERILVDVAGYRARRADALQRFTRQVADEVISSGADRALEPMSASDRKIVHDTVNDIDGVVTRSEGEDPRRYIVLSPSGDHPATGAGPEADEA